MSGPAVLALSTSNITIGDHTTAKFLGFSINVDTVWSTALAMAIVLGLGLYMARRASSGVPSKLQLAYETVVDQVQTLVEDNMGPVAPFVVPLAVTLFVFILVANWIEIIPSGHQPEYLPAPTADVNTTFAMSLLVLAWAIVTGIRRRGLGSWLRGYVQPYPVLLPINVIEEVAKPVSLALRLFGNIFAGGIMLLIIALIPAWGLIGIPDVVWKLFDMFIGLIQAFIFALLTVMYFGFEVGGH